MLDEGVEGVESLWTFALADASGYEVRWFDDLQRLRGPPVVAGSAVARDEKWIDRVGGSDGSVIAPLAQQLALVGREFAASLRRHLACVDPLQ